jgi:muconate cycloisomerase
MQVASDGPPDRPSDLARAPLTIRRVDAIPVALPLTKPVKMAAETVTHARNILVRIEARDGAVGWGEAASAPTMTGDTIAGLVAAVREHLAPPLVGEDAWLRPVLMKRLGVVLYGNTGAHSAVEMALLDLAARSAGVPVIDLIGGAVRREVAPMWLIGNATPDQDVAEAQARRDAGIRFFKLKVAVKPLASEIAAALAVRKALGPDPSICADANCGFAPDAALRYLAGTAEAGLLFLEQPFEPADMKGLAALARTSPIAIGADEGIHSLHDIEAHAAAGAGGVSLKLIKLGGFGAALAAGALCKRFGLAVNIAAKMSESSLAAAANVHLACAVENIDWGVSLTHFYLAEDIVRRPLAMANGRVALPPGPGLGVEVDEAAVARLRTG